MESVCVGDDERGGESAEDRKERSSVTRGKARMGRRRRRSEEEEEKEEQGGGKRETMCGCGC